MLKNWKLRIASAALVAVSVTAGCFDFDEGLRKCQESGPCKEEQGNGDGGTDAGCVVRDQAEEPDDHQDFNCDGFDGVAATALFVDPAHGGDSNTGSPDRPLKTLTEALERIRSGTASGKTAVYLARGTYKENGLKLEVPVSLHGGYGGLNDWFRKPEHTTNLNGGTVGLTVRNLRDAGIVLERLTISSDNGVGAGGPSIALYMVGTDGVLLRQDILSAGQGATGAAGTPGDTGLHGSHGRDGGTAIMDSTRGEAGAPGIQSCGSVDVSGGIGKKGAAAETAGAAGDNGKPLPPGGGGTGGAAGALNAPAPAQNGFQNCRGGDGSDGGTGAPGDAGTPGQSGGGVGELVDGTWVATQMGGAGGMGTPGAGGGGGGSGGSCEPVGFASSAAGGGSGGGGAGGCGGQGGKGGGGGGASIALLLVDSNVALSGVKLQTQGGGKGGAPGAGGQGGQGGQGGPGGAGGDYSARDGLNNVSYSTAGGRGGNGGNGGNGGHGGPGGGGGGGPSVGVWCGPNSGFVPNEALSDEALRPGGSGGTGPGANPGNAGEKHLTFNCPDAGT